MSQTIRPFQIMAKPVCGVCNLDCRYCYYTAKPKELYPEADKFQMSDEVLERYIKDYLALQPERCEFGWQGGEPTLSGLGFFRKIVELQKQYSREGQAVTNALQTNGTLLDAEWCEFLRENKFLVGISLDGPAQWHDAYRRDHEGNPSFHRAWAGLELLRKHGVEYNILVTLNSVNAPHAGDIYRYFVNRGAQYVQYIPILERTADDQPSDFSCTGEQFGRFMLDVFEIWASRDVGKISERFIDNCLHQIIYHRASMCCYADRCANAHVLEFNGDLYACDHFVYGEWKIGNIMETPLGELVRDPRLDEFAELKLQLPAACRECEFLEFCKGGCPKHHQPIGTDPARVNHFCEGYKMFFREALPKLREMAKYIERGQIPPMSGDAQPAQPAPGQQAAFQAGPGPQSTQPALQKPPGRNAPCPCGSGRKFKSCCGRR